MNYATYLQVMSYCLGNEQTTGRYLQAIDSCSEHYYSNGDITFLCAAMPELRLSIHF